MKLDNKKILIGAGVVIIGYLLWKKNKRNSIYKSSMSIPEQNKMLAIEPIPLGGGKDKFGMPRIKPNTIEEERALSIQFFKTLPDEFTIENTRFFKNSNLEFYKQSFSSSGFGAGTPIKISGADFSNAHIEFKNRNTPNKFSESLKSFLEKQPQGFLATPNIYKS